MEHINNYCWFSSLFSFLVPLFLLLVLRCLAAATCTVRVVLIPRLFYHFLLFQKHFYKTVL
jgi:hypothetical protein